MVGSHEGQQGLWCFSRYTHTHPSLVLRLRTRLTHPLDVTTRGGGLQVRICCTNVNNWRHSSYSKGEDPKGGFKLNLIMYHCFTTGMKFLDTHNWSYLHKTISHTYTICMNSRHDATLLFTGTCGCSLPIDSTGGVSAHAQCKQTATAEINEFTGWAIIILQHCMNKIGAHQTMVPWYHGTAHPPKANQLHTQRRNINMVHMVT